MVKIDNAPKARPQIGLNQADVVFEEGVEGGITRFAALFHSEESKPVGPVRSARTTDIRLISALRHPLFAYSGANATFQRYVHEAPLVDVGVRRPSRPLPPGRRPARRPTTCSPRPRSSSTWRPTGRCRRRPCSPSAPRARAASGPGARAVSHARVWWQASKLTEAALGLGRRPPRAGAGPRTARPTSTAPGKQVTPANVVVQFVTYHDTGQVDSTGTAVPEADVVGEGDAWVLTGGMLIPCRWSKASDTDITRYTDASGAEVQLAPGKTWVELVPPSQAEAS